MKKKKFAYALTAILLLGTPLATLVSCNGGGDTPDPIVPPDPDVDATVGSYEASLSKNASSLTYSIGENCSIVISNVKDTSGKTISDTSSIGFDYESSDTSIATISDNGTISFIASGSVTLSVTCRDADSLNATKEFNVIVTGSANVATGGFSYVASDDTYKDKLEILGTLEKWAVDNHLTGMTLFQNGGYVMYNERIQKPTNNYITGYGFGILSEGSITSDLDSESNTNWKRYYHSYGGSTNKQKFNYLDDTGSESADLYGYMTSTYYGTKMNSTKDGYEWYSLLAKECTNASELTQNGVTFNANMPIPLNYNSGTGLATKYKVYLKTGSDGIAFRTLSSKASVQKFDKQGVTLDDYLTPFKVLLNGSIGLARSTDMISDSSSSTLKGAKAFYNLTKDNSNLDDEDIYGENGLFFKLVGITPDYNENSITFEFNTPVNQFTAMSNLSSSLYSPINQEFLKVIGEEAAGGSGDTVYKSAMKEAYGTANSRGDWAPLDTTLSLGPYILEQSDTTMNVYKRNDDWYEVGNGRYNIEGIKITYLAASSSDTNAAFKEFLNGSLDACSIPKDYINQYKDDSRTTQTQGDSTFKLNINSCTQEEWDEIFINHPDASTYNGGKTYNCKPLMSNDNFLDALSFSIDRKTFAENRGVIPSQSYFAPSYLWDPEEGSSYEDTPQHKAVLSEYSPSTYGYNESVAVTLMDQAIEEEINKGNYSGYNDSETIKIEWMNTTDTDEYGKEITGYFETVFKKTDAYKNGFRITFENGDGNTDYQVVYNTMKSGAYDLGFGSISGMQNDPLGFLEVLKTDNSSGFTLNYGKDTSKVDEEDPIIYDGKKWSFDGLWYAANKGAVISEDGGLVTDPITYESNASVGETTRTLFGNSVTVKQMAVQIVIDSAAATTTFKMFTDSAHKDDETATISFTYKEDTATKSGAIISNVGDLFEYRDVDSEGNIESTTEGARVIVYIPTVLNALTTDNQVNTTINYDDLMSASITLNVYMVINDVPSTTTLTIPLKIK